jgi:hypothetical protein
MKELARVLLRAVLFTIIYLHHEEVLLEQEQTIQSSITKNSLLLRQHHSSDTTDSKGTAAAIGKNTTLNEQTASAVENHLDKRFTRIRKYSVLGSLWHL